MGAPAEPRQRGLPIDGIRTVQLSERDRQAGLGTTIRPNIDVPPSFPARDYNALVWAADLCAVE